MGMLRKALSLATIGAIDFWSVHERMVNEQRRTRRAIERQSEILQELARASRPQSPIRSKWRNPRS